MATTDGLATDPAEILPKIGMTGVYTARTPFSNKLNSQVSYSCTDIATIDGLVAQGLDPFTDVYVPVGLTLTDYNVDKDKNHCIVTLQSTQGVVVKIPSSYLVGYPVANGISYARVMLGISLSAIPDTLDLTSLMSGISSLVHDTIGVNSEVKTIVISPKYIISQEDHIALEAARSSKIGASQTDLAKVITLQQQNTDLLLQLSLLQDYVKSHS